MSNSFTRLEQKPGPPPNRHVKKIWRVDTESVILESRTKCSVRRDGGDEIKNVILVLNQEYNSVEDTITLILPDEEQVKLKGDELKKFEFKFVN